jgi:hypothetical protein
MPSRRLVALAFWGMLLGLGSYSLIGAALHYFEMQELVDAALQETSQKRRVVTSMQRPIDSREMAQEVRVGILERARRSGLVLEDDHVIVTPSDQGVTVAVMWAEPALSVVSRGILTIPMSIERSVDLRNGR